MRFIFYICVALLLAGCKPEEQEETSKVVARAGNEQLGIEELNENLVPAASKGDSTIQARRNIDLWATESLLYQEALEKLEGEQASIEREVTAYRRSLVNHLYQLRLVEANLDTNITREEIEDYYNDHRPNFILKENIVKVYYIKVPVKSPALVKIRRLIGSVKPADQEELKSLCIQNAESFFINDSTWLFMEEIKKEIPALREQPDMMFYMGRIVEFSDEFYYYYLKIRDVRVKNSSSPINFERSNIRKFILNGRKAQLINEYKRQLLEKAKEEKRFKVF